MLAFILGKLNTLEMFSAVIMGFLVSPAALGCLACTRLVVLGVNNAFLNQIIVHLLRHSEFLRHHSAMLESCFGLKCCRARLVVTT